MLQHLLKRKTKCTEGSQYCETGNSITGVQIAMAVVIPCVVIGLIIAFFMFKAYRKNKKEALEDDDPDFNGDNTVLPDLPQGGAENFYEYENPFENAQMSYLPNQQQNYGKSEYEMNTINTHKNGFGRNNVYAKNASAAQSDRQISINTSTNPNGGKIETFVLPYQNETISKHSLDNLAKALGTDPSGGYRTASPHGMYKGRENPYSSNNSISRRSSISQNSRPLTGYESTNGFNTSELSLRGVSASPLQSESNSPVKNSKSPLGGTNQNQNYINVDSVSSASPVKAEVFSEVASSTHASEFEDSFSHAQMSHSDQEYVDWTEKQQQQQQQQNQNKRQQTYEDEEALQNPDYSFETDEEEVDSTVLHNSNKGDVDNDVLTSKSIQQSRSLHNAEDEEVPDLKTIIENDKDAVLTSQEEEQINRMKSVYRVYFSRENSIKSTKSGNYVGGNNQSDFDQSNLPPLPTLPKDQDYQYKDRSLEKEGEITQRPESAINLPDFENDENVDVDNDQNFRASVGSSVYNVSANQTQNIHPHYPHQQMQGYIDKSIQQSRQQHYQQQYPQQYQQYPQQYTQQQYLQHQQPHQPVYPQQRRAIRKPEPLKKLENLPSPYELANRHSTLETFTEFQSHKKYQDLGSPSVVPTKGPFNPIEHDEVWSSNGPQQQVDPYQHTQTLPHHIRDSIVMINPVDLNKPASYRPAGSFQQVTRNVSTNSNSSLNLPSPISTTIPKSPSIIQMHSPVFGTNNGFERPHAAENLIPHSGSQSDLRKYMDSANL